MLASLRTVFGITGTLAGVEVAGRTDRLIADDLLRAHCIEPTPQAIHDFLEGYLAGSFTHEFGLGELKVKEAGRTYVAPSGVLVSATYVDFLRRTMSASTVRLRMKGNMEPIVIMANGSAVGVLMPVKQ